MLELMNDIFSFMNNHIIFLNNSKFFAGVIMILLNVGSKFIPIQFSRSAEEYLKMNITKQLLVFAMAWMGTRDIYTALLLTALFIILSDHLFNDESRYCIVPEKSRVFMKLADVNNDGIVTEQELNNALAILEKAKREKIKNEQITIFSQFHNYSVDTNNNFI
jgi:hypothetical protein